MRAHTCECTSCNPKMIPDYNPLDPTIHFREKCGMPFRVSVDGIDVGFTSGITKEGKEGWYQFAGINSDDIHIHKCINDESNACLETRFGNVTVIQDAVPI